MVRRRFGQERTHEPAARAPRPSNPRPPRTPETRRTSRHRNVVRRRRLVEAAAKAKIPREAVDRAIDLSSHNMFAMYEQNYDPGTKYDLLGSDHFRPRLTWANAQPRDQPAFLIDRKTPDGAISCLEYVRLMALLDRPACTSPRRNQASQGVPISLITSVLCRCQQGGTGSTAGRIAMATNPSKPALTTGRVNKGHPSPCDLHTMQPNPGAARSRSARLPQCPQRRSSLRSTQTRMLGLSRA